MQENNEGVPIDNSLAAVLERSAEKRARDKVLQNTTSPDLETFQYIDGGKVVTKTVPRYDSQPSSKVDAAKATE